MVWNSSEYHSFIDAPNGTIEKRKFYRNDD